MKRKLILSLFYMGLVASLVSIVATVFVYQNTLRTEVKQNLVNELRLLEVGYDKLSDHSELKDYSSDDFRITLIDPNGKVLFEIDADASKMSNHLDRPEIKSAVENGSGSDTRISETIGVEDYYYAEALDDGNILRVSTEVSSVFSVLGRSVYILAAIILAIIAVSILVSIHITKRILEPIKKVSKSIDDISLYDKNTYPELVPLVDEIKHQRNIQADMRQEFTANVSHELKTPLTAISGYAEMIETGIANGEDSKKFAAKIRGESARMQTLVGDILKLSELDSEIPSDMNDDINLLRTAKKCKQSLALAAEKKNVKITILGTSNSFKGNQSEIYELIYNLLDNAIKYNRQNGNVDIYITNSKIKISDTGIGISDEDKQRVFERFYRVDKSRSKETGGTGLGLSIVKHIAERHNANITVNSTLNVGTDITVDFGKSNKG